MFKATLWLIVVCGTVVFAQGPPTSDTDNLPPELRYTDPEIKSIMDSTKALQESGEYEQVIREIERALQLSTKKQLRTDRALLELALARAHILKGELPEARSYLASAESLASEAGNLVLEAEILATESAVESTGAAEKAGELANRAVEIARKSKSLQVQSYCLGELAYRQMVQKQLSEARANLEEALSIDKLNHYNLEARHSLYMALLEFVTGNSEKGIAWATSSRDLALKFEDFSYFLQSSTVLARALAQKGQLERSLETLVQARSALKDNGTPLFLHQSAYLTFVTYPINQVALLEATAGCYSIGNRIDDVLRTWQELYSVGARSNFILAEGEAAHNIADIYQTQKNRAEAIKWYGVATDAWQRGGNTMRQMDAMASEAFLLTQDKQYTKAIQVSTALAALARENKDLRREFIYTLALAEALQYGSDKDLYKKTLLEARSLLTESLSVSGVDPPLISELFARLAAVYSSEGNEIQQIISLEEEMTPVALSDKPESMLQLDEEVKRHLESAQVLDNAEKAYKGGDLAKSLLYFELVQHFQQVDAIWRGKANENHDDPIIDKLTEITLQLGVRPEGAKTLEANLHDLGPVAGIVRFSSWVALVYYYAREHQPEQVIHYASLTWPILHLKATEHPQAHDVHMACQYALALMSTGKIDTAVKIVNGCLSAAEGLGDPDLLLVANQLNVAILGMAGKADQAGKSSEYLRQHPSNRVDGLLTIAIAQQSEGEWKSALDTLAHALTIAGSNKDTATLASIHLKIADLIGASGVEDVVQQISHLEAARSLFTQTGDTASQAEVNLRLAYLYIRQRDWKQVDSYLKATKTLAAPLKRLDLEARAETLEGDRYRSSGDPKSALAHFRQAGQIYHDLGKKPEEAEALLNQSYVLEESLYKPQDAQRLALKAKELAEQSSAWQQQIASLRELAECDETVGDYTSSLNALRDALSVANKNQALLISSYVRLQMTGMLIATGQWENALSSVSSALPILQQLNDKYYEFNAYMELIDIYGSRESDLQDFDKALEYAKELKQTIKSLSATQSGRLSLVLYEIHFQQRRFDLAIEDAEAALSTFREEKEIALQAGSLLSLAEAKRSAGDLPGAVRAVEQAEPMVRQVSDFYLTGRFYYGRSNLYKSEGKLQLSIDAYEQVVKFLEDYKAQSIGPSKIAVAESYNYIYGELIDVYYSRIRADNSSPDTAARKAFEIAELNKSRIFTTTWGRSLIDGLRQKLPTQLQDEERVIIERSSTLQNELNQSVDVGGRTKGEIESDLRKISAEENSFEAQLRRSYPVYADARYPRRMTIDDLPLRRGELLVEFKMFDPALFVWIVKGSETGPRVLSFYKVGQTKAWFRERIMDIRGAMNRGDSDSFDPRESEELFNAIFPGESAELLRSAKSIIFVPDDILSLLPMEILSPTATKGEFVLMEKPTSYFPSAAGMRLTRSVGRPDVEWRDDFFAIADPITSRDDARFRPGTDPVVSTNGVEPSQLAYGADATGEKAERNRDFRFTARGYYFDRLPETAHEVSKIAELFPNSTSSTTVRTAMDATKIALLQTDLSRYRFLHFATHGFLPVEESAIEPALILSFDGTNESQMMLTVSEISKMSIHADMVVLSACNTGSGKVTHAEGVASLGSAFLAAGSSSVVVSLWKVADSSTSTFMQQFYKNLLSGMPKNKALAEARKELFSSGKTNPFYWAPFVLSGE